MSVLFAALMHVSLENFQSTVKGFDFWLHSNWITQDNARSNVGVM